MSEENKCFCGNCDECKFKNTCPCYRGFCRCSPWVKLVAVIIFILIIFCLGYCLGKVNNFRHNDWRGGNNCPMMVGQFKDFKTPSSDEATVNITPSVKTPAPQN